MRHAALTIVAVYALGFSGRGVRADDVAVTPGFEEFVVVPLKVHILKAEELPEIDCRLKDEDVTRILGKMNGIWHKAGIHWGLGTVVREPAARQRRYRLARDLDGPGSLGIYRLLVPDQGRNESGLHVYFLHRFPVNGVWFGEDFVMVQETARLREVEGGIDEPVPRVTAHELGHALGLGHRQATTNLLASGTTGTSLNADEVETARKTARATDGAKTVAQWKTAAAEAETAGDRAGARKIWTWLAEIPGSGDEPREQADRLKGEDG